jgi:glycosyltransferase involved in cell wall biosynthesis
MGSSDGKMKVALISKSFDKNSGQGVYKMSGYLADSLEQGGIDVIRISGSPLRCFFRAIFTKADVYHFLMPELCWPVLFRRKKSLATLHDAIIYKHNERHWLSTIYLKLMHSVAKEAGHIITVSENSKKDLMEAIKIPEDKISVIYWGIDKEKFKPIKTEKNKIFTAGYVGGLGKRKNVELLIEAARILGDSVKIKIAGIGPQLESLKKLAEGLQNVEFIGFVPEDKLPEFYNSLDIFVFPSHYEGFGIPVLEAMACGIPIVACDNSSMREIVGNSGILASTNDAKELAEAIADLRDNPAKHKKLGLAARNMPDKFEWSRTAALTKEVYEKIK